MSGAEVTLKSIQYSYLKMNFSEAKIVIFLSFKMPLIILETSYIYRERPPVMKSVNDLKSSHTALHKNINFIFDYKHFKTDSAISLHFIFCLWSFIERACVLSHTLSPLLSFCLLLNVLELGIQCMRDI